MFEKQQEILKLHQEGKRNSQIVQFLSHLNVNRKMVYRTLKHYAESGELKRKAGSGRPRSVRTPRLIKVVRERIRRNPAQSSNKLAQELDVTRTSMKRILHQDLGLKAFRKRKVHGLTEAQKVKRYERSGTLLAWHAESEIIFSDEKLFLLQESHNPQNDRIWTISTKELPCNLLHVQRFQNVSSVMVWGAICERGKLPLVFIEKGVKVNQNYYKDEVLKKILLPEAQKLFKNDYFCFQQDGAPAHTAKTVQEWCEENLPDFIPKDDWPPSSPDLNPLDFCIWGYMLASLRIKKIHSIGEFKYHLAKIWDEIPMEVVRAACKDFVSRLRLVRQSKGERFETNS